MGQGGRSVRPVHCEIFIFDLPTQSWKEIKVNNMNRALATRRNHCGTILGDWMLVYGGLNSCVQYLDDLQAFNFLTSQWRQIEPFGQSRPPALCRSAMRAVFHKQRKEQLVIDFNQIPPLDWAKVDQNLRTEGFFMYGGQDRKGEASSDLWVLKPLKKGLTWVNGSRLCEG